MYHSGGEAAAGGSPDYWEAAWSDGSLAEALRFCEVDPLRPLLERYFVPGARVLEGGCGRGQYVEYYSRRGVRMVGLDFATGTLASLKRFQPDLLVCGGDVSRLPFADATFQAYYSGGVVEHFEAGPLPALREARRVLSNDGVLLVSVPYLNPLRRMLSSLKRDRRRVDQPLVDGVREPRRRFFQYVFTPREFRSLARQAGFEVVVTQPYAIYWGLMEVPLAGSVLDGLRRRRERPRAMDGAEARARPSSVQVASTPARPSWVKRLLVSEDVSVPVAGWGLRFAGWFAANMMMYVCAPAESTRRT